MVSLITKKRCNIEGCTNQVVKVGVCLTHGAKVKYKRCSHKGCTSKVQQGGVCTTHGANKKQCNFEGCIRFAQKGGICRRHSSKRINADNINISLQSNANVTSATPLCQSIDYVRRSLIVGFGCLLVFQDVLHQIMQLGHCLFLISMIRNQVMMVHSTSKRRGSRPLLVARRACLKKTMRASTNKMLF